MQDQMLPTWRWPIPARFRGEGFRCHGIAIHGPGVRIGRSIVEGGMICQ
jgi:hypothetical protein